METILKIEEIADIKIKGEYGGKDGFAITTDKQVIKLLIDNGTSCCEDWGYFLSEDKFSGYIGSALLDMYITTDALETESIVQRGLNQYLFKDDGEYDELNVMFVSLVTSVGLLQFTAYNSHNGYYGHGAYVFSEQLTHEETL